MILATGDLSLIFLCLLAFVLLVVSFIDADTQEIPDGPLIFAALVGIGFVVAGQFSCLFYHSPSIIGAGLGILVGGLPLLIIDRITLILFKKDGFGYGDVKLMAVCGMFLGWQLTLVAFFIAFITGGMYATFLLVSRRVRRGEYIAFGPFLCAGVIAAIWFGQELTSFIL